MSGWLLVLLWGLAAGALLGLHTAFWRRRLRVHRRADEVHFVKAADGWSLALHRHRPALQRFAEPLVLCHGLGANRFNFDLDGRISLARHLAERGFDVWVLELRGAGLSDAPGWFTGRSWNWDFDTHLGLDAPAALDEVRRATGQRRVFWVGHSMGGMLGYALAGQPALEALAGLVAVGSPGRLSPSALRPAWLLRLLVNLPVVPTGPLGRCLAPFVSWVARPFYHPGGIEPRLVRRALANLNESLCSTLVRQFLGWGQVGRFVSRDGSRDYLAEVALARAPLFLLAAHRDLLAPPDSLKPVYEAWGFQDREIRVFGLDAGDDHDFGHGDLVLGRHAPEMVYPEISGWLEARATRLPATEPALETPAPEVGAR
jgi:pimeloyl-ACP methyl ester carboxylesterase